VETALSSSGFFSIKPSSSKRFWVRVRVMVMVSVLVPLRDAVLTDVLSVPVASKRETRDVLSVPPVASKRETRAGCDSYYSYYGGLPLLYYYSGSPWVT